jgi:cellulose synthase/poly-beta-1,6-N-acetylglucosamine synthase-like glycosyltransferase
MTTLFLIASLLLFYIVLGYPLLMLIVAHVSPKFIQKKTFYCPLSVVVCVRDEVNVIGERISNLLAMDYPKELVEIIVVSDGSTDGTDKVVQSYEAQGVTLIVLDKPIGKASALNAGIAVTKNEIVLLCDACQSFTPDVAQKLTAFFGDHTVGAVSGRLVLQPSSSTAAGDCIGGYWNYEVWLRGAESKSGSVVGVTGAIYALRKSMYSDIPAKTVLDDVLIPMQIVMQGGRVLYEPRAIAYDTRRIADRIELTRKVRTLYGNLQLLSMKPELLLPWKNPVWFRFVSHKLMRLLLPFLLLICLFSSLFAGGVLSAIGGIQTVFWVCGIICLKRNCTLKICKMASGFLLLNIAVVLAWWRWLTCRGNVWTQSSSSLVEKYVKNKEGEFE